jgi:hypothetical protein
MSSAATEMAKTLVMESAGELIETCQPTQETIASLAYSYWQARGCPFGAPEDDWFGLKKRCADSWIPFRWTWLTKLRWNRFLPAILLHIKSGALRNLG